MAENQLDYAPSLLRGNTEILVLSLIDKEDSTYGYNLIKKMASKSHGYFRFKEGTIYPALHKLENDGLIISRWQELPSGQSRRYYSITEKGREALREKIAVWQSFAAAVNQIIKPAQT